MFLLVFPVVCCVDCCFALLMFFSLSSLLCSKFMYSSREERSEASTTPRRYEIDLIRELVC